MALGDDRKIAILEFVREHPDTSFSKMALVLKDRQVGAKDTIKNNADDLTNEHYLDIFRAKRKGQSDHYYITEKGLRELENNPKAGPVKRGLIKLGFSTELLKNIDREAAEKFLDLMNDPDEEKKVGKLIGSMIAYYASNLNKPNYTIEEFKDLDRYFFLGSFPKDESELIKNMIQFGNFNDSLEAFSFIMTMGLDAFRNSIRSGFNKNPTQATLFFMAIRHKPGEGYVKADFKDIKRSFEKMPSEQVKETVLKMLNPIH
jgi:hypothetical protein